MIKTMLLFASISFINIAYANIELNAAGLFVEESEGEGVLYVTNTSEYDVLVYAKEELEETMEISGESLFYVSPPVSKLGPNQKQLIRVILKKKNLKSQKLGRLLIQEVPYIKDPSANIVSFAKAYNIPALVHPTILVEDYMPWKKAKLMNIDGEMILVNDSNYLIKILPDFSCTSDDGLMQSTLSSPYIMPNTKVKLIDQCKTMDVKPVSNEGKILDEYRIVETLNTENK